MKELGFGLVDQRTVIVVLITATLSTLLFGFTFPLDLSSVINSFYGLVTLTGYLYFARTIIRFPFALFISSKAAVKGRDFIYGYKHDKNELYDRLQRLPRWLDNDRLISFILAFFDSNNWKGFLGFFDRLCLIASVVLATIPNLGQTLMKIGGVIGLCFMILIYLFAGTFSFLVDDAIKKAAEERAEEQTRLRRAIYESAPEKPKKYYQDSGR